jgi:formate/nitrite transporter FocA (FNT family)
MGYKHTIDPYVAVLKRSEHKAIGYGFLALFLLVLAFQVASIGSGDAGQFSALVEPVRFTVGLLLLCGSGLSTLAAIWFIGRYVYFVKWPERFE